MVVTCWTAVCLLSAAIPAGPSPVEVQIRNVTLHMDSSIALEIRSLRGEMAPLRSDEPVTFDDRRSFVTRIRSGEIAIDVKTFSDLLNHFVFSYPGAPLKNLEVTIDGERIQEKGTMRKGIDVPFEIEGTPSVTPDGKIRLHAETVKSAHVPFKGLLHFFGSDLSRLVNLKQDRGVRLDGDDIVIDPTRILPPPRIAGHVSAMHLEQDKIVLIFGSGARDDLPIPHPAPAYIYHRGGVLRFGKLTMSDSDLEIVNESGGSWFDFSLPEYDRQLVAGYSKNTPSHGLIVFMPDFRSLKTSR